MEATLRKGCKLTLLRRNLILNIIVILNNDDFFIVVCLYVTPRPYSCVLTVNKTISLFISFLFLYIRRELQSYLP